MNIIKTNLVILVMLFSSIAVAGEAHVCTSKVLPIEKQEQISDETIFKCAGIKSGKNTFTINELAQSNWQVISVEEGQAVYNSTKNEIYHQVVIQKP